MIVKKFQAPTETEAVLKARDELGSSAVAATADALWSTLESWATGCTTALRYSTTALADSGTEKPDIKPALLGQGAGIPLRWNGW